MSINTKPNIDRPDDFYQELIDLHRDLSDEQSRDLNAKLILIFANHIGDMDTLSEGMEMAKKGIET